MKTKTVLTACFLFLSIYVKSQDLLPFTPVDTNYIKTTIVVPPSPLVYDILCVEGDSIAYDQNSDTYGPVKGSFSHAVFFATPENNNPYTSDSSGYILVGHELKENNDAFATAGVPYQSDGGGVTQMKVKRNSNGHWNVVPQTVSGHEAYYRNVNFSSVGGTINNSGICKTGKNTALIGENTLQSSNKELNTKNPSSSDNSGIRDTSDFSVGTVSGTVKNIPSSIKRFENMNWVTEIDPANASVIKKHYSMGRFGHSNILQVDNSIYMTSDTEPSVLFRFVPYSSTPQSMDFSNGILFAYKQLPSGGKWIILNKDDLSTIDDDDTYQDFSDLKRVTEQALDSGATMFNNLRGMVFINPVVGDLSGYQGERIFIAERGMDHSGNIYSDPAKRRNGVLAAHLEARDQADGNNDNIFADPYGRILELNTTNLSLKVFMEGGAATAAPAINKGVFFSNPDALSSVYYYDFNQFIEREYLIISEDLIDVSNGRNPVQIVNKSHGKNEVYWLNLTKAVQMSANYDHKNDLKLFSLGPKGARIIGANFSAEGNTVFVTTQNPNPSNQYPFNKSLLMAVSVEGETLTSMHDRLEKENNFEIWPNPVSRTLYFNVRTDVTIYDVRGIVYRTQQDTNEVDLWGLQPGLYFIKTADNQVRRLILQ